MEMCVASPTDLPTLARLARGRKYWGAMGVRNSSATEAEYTKEVAKRNLCSGSTLSVQCLVLLLALERHQGQCCETLMPQMRNAPERLQNETSAVAVHSVSGPVTCSSHPVAESVVKLPRHGGRIHQRVCKAEPLQWQYTQCPLSGVVACLLQTPWAVADSVVKLPHATEANHIRDFAKQNLCCDNTVMSSVNFSADMAAVKGRRIRL